MKRIFLVVALVLSASFTLAQSAPQKWTAGWDIFNEPLNYEKSNVRWSVNPTTNKLMVTFNLVGATPSKLYAMGLAFFCTTFPTTFGGFPMQNGGGTCYQQTRQGVTATIAQVQVGVVTTNTDGNGTFTVVMAVPSGTYRLEFYVYDGAYCAALIGEGCSSCSVPFQSPGPFGTWTTITVP